MYYDHRTILLRHTVKCFSHQVLHTTPLTHVLEGQLMLASGSKEVGRIDKDAVDELKHYMEAATDQGGKDAKGFSMTTYSASLKTLTFDSHNTAKVVAEIKGV